MYCPQCGQQLPHRLTVGHVLHEVVHVFTHADKSILGYAWQVVRYPGRVVQDYLLGRRKRYFNPFQFLLLVVGLCTVVATHLHYYEQVGMGVQQAIALKGASPAQLARVSSYFYGIGKYFNVWWLLLLPLHALFAWQVYRPQLNYAEAFLMIVVVGSAFQLLLLLALPTVFQIIGRTPGSSTAALQGSVYLLYLTLIGRLGLGRRWGPAVGRAVLVSILAGLCNYLINFLAFNWYVFG
ncbi:DUF3667 domain-containing protein [Hymenobacter metallilatus]|uniref:DUF3667 domain-containing protein n=1 Tax=Hymenobacter metallilatus TaxID=2493666 RepID=UPI00163A964C|nr:DUF3667 domain-containing protein [Hymenobacter metallilatus]